MSTRTDAMMDENEGIRTWARATFGKLAHGIEVDTDDLPEICPICGRKTDDIAKRHRTTAYVTDDEANWLVSCADCFAIDEESMAELWDDYYTGCL